MDMGERKCAFDGCNALEFRTSGYCLRHKGSLVSESSPSSIKKTTPIKEPTKSSNNLLTITIISVCVAFFPILMINDDTTGGGGAVFLMCMTIPVGVAILLVGGLSSTISRKKVQRMSFDSASAKLEEIFNSTLQGEDLDRAISSIPKRLEKFEGKWDELIVWAEEKYGPQ